MPFSDHTFRFLQELAANNDKAWFAANQDRFEDHVRGPALDFIDEASGWFELDGRPWLGEAKKAGGSLSRIHRDVRFSKDKTPFHTHMTIHFRRSDFDKKAPQPMLGIRFAHDEVGIGGGIYGGDTSTLNRIRDAIVADPDSWTAAKADLDLWGDSLKTAPKGYDKDHPLIEDIRRKAYMASHDIDRATFYDGLLPAFQAGVDRLTPLTDFLADALR